ncbi:polyribitolphosphotransferase [Sporolactobacillus sp. THM7-4]|nr:polyribitolphosphotransferase [Sporolactobacillus sp. THM7-4]
MLSRIRRKVGRLLRKLHLRESREKYDIQVTDDPLQIDDERIVIQREHLRDSLPLLNKLADEAPKLIPHRKVVSIHWNGPIMEIKGYYYLENIPLLDEDLVKKELILAKDMSGETYWTRDESADRVLPLKDVRIDEMTEDNRLRGYYEWAGFSGKFNFSTLSGGKPLVDGTYTLLLKIEVRVLSKGQTYSLTYPLGNVQNLMANGFHSTKMEHFSARRQMSFNLIASYDNARKTIKLVSKKLKDFDPTELVIDNKERRGLFYTFFSKVVFHALYDFFCLFRLDQKKILFASDSRTELGSNFKFVYDELLRRDLDFKYRFSLKSNIREKKTYGEIIRLAYLLATSKYILLDDFYPEVYPLKIRKHAELIQLWHAVGAFKTFGYSRIGRVGGPSPKSKNHKNYTKAIVSSHNVARHYAEGFGIDEEKVVATGIPRTDVFFDHVYQEKVKKEIYAEHPYLKGKKVILFAPTFRGNGQQSAYYPTEVLELGKLYHELKDEYVFILKIHPFVKNDFTIPYQYSNFFYDFSDYRDINDLLFITDILITDYSSVCFEFALLNRPMLFFAFDIIDYVKTRDFYYDYTSFIPGPLVKSTGEIIQTIQNQDFHQEKIKPFVHYFFDQTDGKSSARVVDQLILGSEDEVINEEQDKPGEKMVP